MSAERPYGRPIALAAALAAALGVGIGIGMVMSSNEPHDMRAMDADQAEDQIWTCAMHPQIRMAEAGQCPICGMDLVPVESSAGEATEHEGHVILSAKARALAKIQTEPVKRTDPRAEVRLLGRVDYDETRLRTVTPWTAGRIDRLRVRVTGSRIGRNQAIARLYSPEIYAAMRELVLARGQAKKLERGLHGSAGLANAALASSRQRLRLLGVPDKEIERVEKSGKAPTHIEIRSPFGGTVLERLVEEGDYVKPGTPLYNIADLSKVWVQIDAYESDLPHLRVGQEVVIEVRSLAGEPFVGKVAFIDPVVDKNKRTTRVRVEVGNKAGQLRPGMFAEAVIHVGSHGEHGQLVIPSSAPLFTGRRSVVYVEVPGADPPAYALREVRLGPKSGPVYPVLAGLSEGERVVTEGAFVLDADLQLQGGRSMMTLADDTAEATEALSVPPAFREALRPWFEAYADTQEKLAADDLDGARTALAQVAELVNEADPPGPKMTRDAWQALASKLAGHARHASATTSDGELRSAFEKLSMEAELVLRRFGNPLDTPVRVAFCPMAFDSKGAAWIQRSDSVQNPYYGSSMLRCGEVRATVLPGESLATTTGPEAPPAAAAGGHQH